MDHSVQDYPGAMQAHSVILSTSKIGEPSLISKDLIVVNSHGSNHFSFDTLKDELSRFSERSLQTRSLREVSTMDLKDTHCIFVDELAQSVLTDPSAADFSAIQNLCSARGILWVVRGAMIESSRPDSSMAVGLARCIRSENPSIRLITLDLDGNQQLSPSCTSGIIADIYGRAFATHSNTNSAAMESEYLERKGYLHIPRVVQDLELAEFVRKATQKAVPEYQTYLHDDRALTLRIGNPGFLDTLYFADDDGTDSPLKPSDVKIQVKASSLNFRDVLAALDKVPFDSLGTDCAGIIVATGSDITDIKVGDRVCAFSSGALSTIFRCAASCVVKIPDTMGFDVAASMPSCFCTVYHSLINIAGLSKGEST